LSGRLDSSGKEFSVKDYGQTYNNILEFLQQIEQPPENPPSEEQRAEAANLDSLCRRWMLGIQ
jgi:hypothetical protein